MPLLPADKLVLDEALDGQGVPATITASIYAAIDAAGFNVVPSGGDPAAIVDDKPGTVFAISGFPGHYLKQVEYATGQYARWLEIVNQSGTQRIALVGSSGSSSIAFADLTGKPTTLAGYGITDAAASTHTHAASAMVSGTLDIARIPTGTSASTVCIGNDARLSDSRTPTAHNQAWSTITSTPTTLAGYGLRDAAPLDRQYAAITVNGASGTPGSIGAISPTGGTGGAGQFDTDGPWIEYTTTASAGDVKGTMLTNAAYFGRGFRTDLWCRVKTSGSFANAHLQVGFTATGALATFGGDPTSSGLAAAFFYVDASGNLSARTNDGTGTATSSGTLQTLATNTVYVFAIEMESATVRFYVNGTLAHTASTDLPGTAALNAGFAIRTDAATAKSVRFGGARFVFP